MSIVLSSSDLENLGRAVRVLTSPIDHPTPDAWRSAVNHHLRELLSADSAGFLLPGPDGLTLYSDEHDVEALSRYPEWPPPPLRDGTPAFARVLELGVGTTAQVYGPDFDVYLQSEYYRDFAGANGAHDTLAAAVSAGRGDSGAMAMLQFWHARPDGRRFSDREVAMLRLLFPAFRAGVESYLKWGSVQADLLNTLDGLGQPALVFDLSGRVIHETPAFDSLLEGDEERLTIRSAMESMAESLRGSIIAQSGDAPSIDGCSREIATRSARYRASGCLYGESAAASGPRVVVVGLQRLTPRRRRAEDLQETFALTPAEVQVAGLLAQGKSNADIAGTLYISPHTARRHTERVLQKLGIRSRAEVAARLYV